jgi:hypothetical protein
MADEALADSGIGLTAALDLMKDFGFFEVVLPLILVFAVFYGILSVTKIFGDPKDNPDTTKPLYAIISFVAAFLVISSTEVVRMINEFIPSAAMLMVLVLLLLMFMGMFGIQFGNGNWLQDKDGKNLTWFGRIAIVLMVLVFLGIVDMSMDDVEIPIIHGIAESFYDDGSAGSDGSSTGEGISSDYYNVIVVLVLMVGLPFGVIYYIVHGNSGLSKDELAKAYDEKAKKLRGG